MSAVPAQLTVADIAPIRLEGTSRWGHQLGASRGFLLLDTFVVFHLAAIVVVI